MVNILQFSAMRHINDQKLFQEPEDIDTAFINGDLTLEKLGSCLKLFSMSVFIAQPNICACQSLSGSVSNSNEATN